MLSTLSRTTMTSHIASLFSSKLSIWLITTIKFNTHGTKTPSQTQIWTISTSWSLPQTSTVGVNGSTAAPFLSTCTWLSSLPDLRQVRPWAPLLLSIASRLDMAQWNLMSSLISHQLVSSSWLRTSHSSSWSFTWFHFTMWHPKLPQKKSQSRERAWRWWDLRIALTSSRGSSCFSWSPLLHQASLQLWPQSTSSSSWTCSCSSHSACCTQWPCTGGPSRSSPSCQPRGPQVSPQPCSMWSRTTCASSSRIHWHLQLCNMAWVSSQISAWTRLWSRFSSTTIILPRV